MQIIRLLCLAQSFLVLSLFKMNARCIDIQPFLSVPQVFGAAVGDFTVKDLSC